MSIIKTYRLLKDLPDCKAGSIFTFDGDCNYDYESTQYTDGKSWYRNVVVENNLEWFEELKEVEVKARITLVSELDGNKYRQEIDFPTTQLDKDKLWRQYMFVLDKLSKMPCKPAPTTPSLSPVDGIDSLMLEFVKDFGNKHLVVEILQRWHQFKESKQHNSNA